MSQVELGTSEADLLQRYPRAIAHMRRQLESGRLGLVVGAGVNKAIGFPDWTALVERIANHQEVGGAAFLSEVGETPLPLLTQMLLHHYGSSRLPALRKEGRQDRDAWRLISAEFRRIMHECLYSTVPKTEAELRNRDRFFQAFLTVVRRSPMTVTYNFDDTLERLLLTDPARDQDERESTRGFETITDARQQFRLTEGVIYHPNGYLPRNLLESTGQPVVFTEESFADQLLDSLSGQYSTLLHHFSKVTCLFVGLSLDDTTLRHLLHQGAKFNPGHYHYFISYQSGVDPEHRDEREARESANFEVMNLVTLFLNEERIESLGRILSAGSTQLRRFCDDQGVDLRFCYYLTGVPGIGKTTTLSYFKNLVTYDEWLEEQLPEMSRSWTTLNEEEVEKVDRWILNQFGLKNRQLLDDADADPRVGISLVDRCLPDPIAFTPDDEWSTKASQLIQAVAPGKSGLKVRPGHVILLHGDPQETVIRARMVGKETTEQSTARLQDDTHIVYTVDGVTQVDVRDMTVAEVVRRVAHIIHREEYVACDLQGRLEEIAANGRPSVPDVSNS